MRLKMCKVSEIECIYLNICYYIMWNTVRVGVHTFHESNIAVAAGFKLFF